MRIGRRVLRYETILEMLEDGPVSSEEIYENLVEFYTVSHISDVISQMEKKGYVNFQDEKILVKSKDLFYNEL